MNIIILDDDKTTNFLNERIIKKAFPEANVNVFDKASELLAFLNNADENSRFKLLLDVNMPEMNGFQFLDECQSRSLRAKLEVTVMLSTESPMGVKENMNSRSVEQFIQKPLNENRLKEVFSHD
jgi:DNA-binding NtrC family response regulator